MVNSLKVRLAKIFHSILQFNTHKKTELISNYIDRGYADDSFMHLSIKKLPINNEYNDDGKKK